jgi:hypothetical protein
MLKESKIRVLENFYALDYIFFGKPVNEVEMCCPIVKEEYLSVKGALLSVFVEMLKILDHKPGTVQESIDGKVLNTMAKKSASIARENSEKIVTTQKSRGNIKESLQDELKSDPDADVGSIVEKAIRSKAFGLAVDNLMVARSLTEAKQPEKMNEWEGRIVEDSYKILRDSLVEAAYQILYDVTDDDVKKLTKEEAIAYSASKIIAMARKQGSLIEKQGKAGCEKWKVTTPFKGQEFKNKMMACKAAAAIKGLNSSAAYAKKLAGHCSDDPASCKKAIYAFMVDIKDEIKDNQSYLKKK